MNATTRKLLVIEDDPGLQTQLRWCFENYEVVIAGDREAALGALEKDKLPVITLDLGLPPDAEGTSEGFALLEEILLKSPHSKVIVVTGNNDREHATRSVAMGAYDFFYKPIDADMLEMIVNRAYRLFELEEENRRLSSKKTGSPLEGVITGNDLMLQVCRKIEKVAPTDATVLILGESGTGKELLARSLHGMSARRENRFVAINCAAIPENLLESELFGYEKGAFTGAAKQTLGKIETASGGTLFLDEVGDMPLPLQAKLLRFLQERVVERVGGRKEIPVDVRVICATHKNLHELMRTGDFREDLYYRVSELSITIPSLREREGDALLLARVFLERICEQQGKKGYRFSKDALAAIENYSWPGNVRELENRVKRAVIMAEHKQMTAADLELGGNSAGELATFNLREIRDRADRQAITRALNHVSGKVSQAAELLGVSRPTMYDLLRKFGLKPK
ncbi:MAG: PEP-CTERM-box response regulator transcription factor [Gammaproteobacteria bacterium]|nr:MAG: PEP-CTERM-box response regulator transcription factor [Gammaproteobacteria bacterium]